MTAAENRLAQPRGLFLRWSTLILWLIPSFVLTIVLARIAVWLEREGYVSALSPIVLGAALGCLVAFLAQRAREPSRIAVLVVTFALALLCVTTEHFLFFLDYRTKIAEAAQRDPKLQIVQAAGDLPVPTFGEFLRAQAPVRIPPGAMPNWLWWIINATLTIVTSMAAAVWRSRRPNDPYTDFTDHCRLHVHLRHWHRYRRMPAYRADDRAPRRTIHHPRLHAARNRILPKPPPRHATFRRPLGRERSRAESPWAPAGGAASVGATSKSATSAPARPASPCTAALATSWSKTASRRL